MGLFGFIDGFDGYGSTEMEFPSKQFLVKVVLLTWPLQMIGKTC